MKDMKANFGAKTLVSLGLLVALFLELKSNGICICYATYPNLDVMQSETFCYFSKTPFMFGNVGPLITGLGTCVSMCMVIFIWFSESKTGWACIFTAQVANTFFSILPCIHDDASYTFISFYITLLQLACLVVSLTVATRI